MFSIHSHVAADRPLTFLLFFLTVFFWPAFPPDAELVSRTMRASSRKLLLAAILEPAMPCSSISDDIMLRLSRAALLPVAARRVEELHAQVATGAADINQAEAQISAECATLRDQMIRLAQDHLALVEVNKSLIRQIIRLRHGHTRESAPSCDETC